MLLTAERILDLARRLRSPAQWIRLADELGGADGETTLLVAGRTHSEKGGTRACGGGREAKT